VGRYVVANRRDPVEEFGHALAAAWGDPETRRPIVWPLFVRAGRLIGGRAGGRADGRTKATGSE